MRRFLARLQLRRNAPAILGVTVAIFVLANVGMGLAYRGRALPNYHMGKLDAGGKSFSELGAADPSTILPARLTFRAAQKSLEVSPGDMGIKVDVQKSLQSGRGVRWLPVLSLFGTHHAKLALQINQQKFDAFQARLHTALDQKPVKKHIIFKGTDFRIAPSQDGHVVEDASLQNGIATALRQGMSDYDVSTRTVAASDTSDLSGALKKLQKQLEVKLSFSYGGQTLRPSKADIGSWFETSGQTMRLSAARFKTYIQKVGIRMGIAVANQSNLAAASAYALGKNIPMNFAVVPSNDATIVRTYCTAVRGVSSSVLQDLDGKLAATYADARGWNDHGKIVFQKVDSGCQYTVWMSATASMASFGSICDDYWNCQVGANVIMNYDRWKAATPSWNRTGDSLEDYRVLMINHETGHRLGFFDNYTCPARGTPAPVMVQQSIDLKGCTFNIWPLPSELKQLGRKL